MAYHLNAPCWAAMALAATVVLAPVPAVNASARVELFTTDGTTRISERVLDAICQDVPANTVAIEIVMGQVSLELKAQEPIDDPSDISQPLSQLFSLSLHPLHLALCFFLF